jgi:hypothetical protein
LQAAQACSDDGGEGCPLCSWQQATGLPARPHSGPPSSVGAVQGAAGTPTDLHDNASSKGVSQRGSSAWVRLPLLLELCVCTRPLAWVDPMLEEPVASLVVSRPIGAPTPRCPPAPTTASQEVEASQVDTHSTEKAAQWTMDSPPLSPRQEQPQVTPPQERLACMPRHAQEAPTPSP